jgi:hypothetical protein
MCYAQRSIHRHVQLTPEERIVMRECEIGFVTRGIACTAAALTLAHLVTRASM